VKILEALLVVLSAPEDHGRGLLRWEPAMWSALAAVLVATVPAVMGLRILATAFLCIAAALFALSVISIAVATSARLKETPNA
jgi:hypothetical protein